MSLPAIIPRPDLRFSKPAEQSDTDFKTLRGEHRRFKARATPQVYDWTSK